MGLGWRDATAGSHGLGAIQASLPFTEAVAKGLEPQNILEDGIQFCASPGHRSNLEAGLLVASVAPGKSDWLGSSALGGKSSTVSGARMPA